MGNGSDYIPGRKKVTFDHSYNSYKIISTFITTSNLFQLAHEFNFQIIEEKRYRLSFMNILKGNNVIKIILDDVIEMDYERTDDMVDGIYYSLFSKGNHKLSFFIKSQILGQESQIIKTRMEYFAL